MAGGAAEPAASAAATSWWRRLVPRSLTARLVAGVVALVVVVVVATAVGTYFALRAFLFTRLDQQVRTALEQNPQTIEQSQQSANSSRLHAPQRLWWVVFDAAGGTEFTPTPGDGGEALELSPAVREQIISDARAGRESMRVVSTVDGEQVRIAARLSGPASEPFVFVVGLSQSEVQRTLRRLVEMEVIITAAAVVVALGASRYLVQFSLRRLHRVTHTARDVASELSPEGRGLDRRVPVDAPGTEVGQLADSMNTLLAAVETQFAARLQSEERMRQFLADASHELRTPLTSIRGYAELARMRRENGHPPVAAAEDGTDDLARIEAEGTRMSRLVDDLLLLARGDQNLSAGQPPDHGPVDLADIVDDAVSGVRASFPQRTVEVEVPDHLQVRGDYDQLLRAVRNLVTNAAAYTRADGWIRVRARPALDGAGVIVDVADEGPGLSPAQAAHAFERFWRADEARNRAHGGSGLGLPIVESIARGHGGSVSLHSSVEGGTVVSLWLPRNGRL